MTPKQLTDPRVQRVLRGIREHEECSMSEIWDLEWQKHFTGYNGTGSFNYGYVERIVPKLIKAGLVVRGYKFRLKLTPEGGQAIQPRR